MVSNVKKTKSKKKQCVICYENTTGHILPCCKNTICTKCGLRIHEICPYCRHRLKILDVFHRKIHTFHVYIFVTGLLHLILGYFTATNMLLVHDVAMDYLTISCGCCLGILVVTNPDLTRGWVYIHNVCWDYLILFLVSIIYRVRYPYVFFLYLSINFINLVFRYIITDVCDYIWDFVTVKEYTSKIKIELKT